MHVGIGMMLKQERDEHKLLAQSCEVSRPNQEKKKPLSIECILPPSTGHNVTLQLVIISITIFGFCYVWFIS